MRKSILLTMGLVAAFAVVAHAGQFTLVDSNSTVDIDTESQAGLNDWVVDGVDHSFQQWFWFRTGGAAFESSIDTLPIALEGTSDTNFDGNDETLFVRFSDGATEIEITYVLSGGSAGTGTSDVAEVIKVKNISGASQDYSFFQYADFDLNDTIGNDTGVMLNANTVQQSDSSAVLTETVATPAADHYELDIYPSTLNHLNDGAISTLNDMPGFGTSITGDVTWAFQWDFSLADGGTYIISKDKNIRIPAPGALLLAGLGLPMVGWVRRKLS